MKNCIECNTSLVEGAKFCHICGTSVQEMRIRLKEKEEKGEIPLYSTDIHTSHGKKTIEVWCHDITTFPYELDILTISAFRYNYGVNTPTVIGALYNQIGIDTNYYAYAPLIDLRKSVNCWLSEPVLQTDANKNIKRLGCVEMSSRRTQEEDILNSIRGYCHMLDLAADMGLKMNTIAMPLLGSGNQHIDPQMMLVPMISEAVNLLKRNPGIQKLLFIDRNFEKARLLTEVLEKSYQMADEKDTCPERVQSETPYVFISYSTHGDTPAAQLMCQLLKEKGIQYWYAPENIASGEYASQIVEALEKCTHFICLISENSMASHHVLNELNLAFQHMKDGLRILPFKLDSSEIGGAFKYYLSTIQVNIGFPPPQETRMREFINKIF